MLTFWKGDISTLPILNELRGDALAASVEIINVNRAYTSVVRISEPAHAPRYWLPFESGLANGSWSLEAGSVIAVGDGGQIRVYDYTSGQVIAEATTESFPQAALSSDRRRLYIYKTYSIEVWTTKPLQRVGRFDSVVVDPMTGARLAGEGLWRHKTGVAENAAAIRLHTYGKLSEHADGRVLISLFDEKKGLPNATLIVDPATATAEIHRHSQVGSFFRRMFASLNQSMTSTGSLEAAVQRHHAETMARWERKGGPSAASLSDPQAEKFVDRHIAHAVQLAGFSEAEVIAALNGMVRDIESRGLKTLLRLGNLDFIFLVAGQTYREREFFDALVQRGMTAAVPALRQLLTAYHAGFEGGEGSQPRNEYISGTPTGGLAHAMRALLFLDRRRSEDVFRTYIAKRDGEHEQFATETIYPEYVARLGITSDGDIRLAVAVALNIIWGGRGPVESVWREHGLIEIAKRQLTPARFAEIVSEEIKALDLEPQWDFQDSQGAYYLRTLLDAVPTDDQFGRVLRVSLAEHWPEFADAISRHRKDE